MIEIYTGVPGSGKSAHAAANIREILNAPRRDQPVLANFRLSDGAPVAKPHNFTYLPNEDMSAGALIDFACEFWDSGAARFREDYIKLYVDEAQLLFNSRRWSDKSRMAYLEFLSQSRKYGYHIIMIAQHLKMIDNQFRMLVEVECNHRRIRSMGPVGTIVAAPFGGKLYMNVRYLVQGNERLNMEVRRYSKKDFAMYDSYATFVRQEG